jgi:hypothetical protein
LTKELRISLVPDDRPDGEQLLDAARHVAATLALGEYLSSLTLVVDDIFDDDRAWFESRPGGHLEIYCHEGNFLPRTPELHSMMPRILPWEFKEKHADPAGGSVYSRPQTERFLFHELQALKDMLDGSIVAAGVPADLAEAFQEAWAVCIDGRLRRQSLPGLTIAERRRIFYRIFSEGGVLLPSHWDVFHQLWECDSPDNESLLDWVSRLPALRLSATRQE